ncbi:MAG TPA: DNA mismatch repair protein MutS [Chitinivibrionales bacterium]|nr:DNA mismatch repair protein MutS [Chitinivibrionales bacterium]
MTSLNFQSPQDSLTPLMRQYNAIKAQNPETVLLYRMGDFYEMFNDDAKIASKVLGITLTSRNHGSAEDVPLAGFPYHALDRYANRLVKAGYKIAICEQTEDPKNAKGVVKRDIVEIITAGTATEDNFIEEKSNNFIVAAVAAKDCCGAAICDLSTGLFQAEEIPVSRLAEELVRIGPAEVLLSGGEENPLAAIVSQNLRQVPVSKYDPWKFAFENAAAALTSHFGVATLQGMGLERFGAGICAAGGLLSYLKEQKKNELRHIVALLPRTLSSFADLDPSTIRNLELLRPMHTDDEGGTLLSVLDKTSTAMGARLLKTWITHPLRDAAAINERLDCVAWLKADVFVRGEAELFLKQIADVERLVGRVTYERANARDVLGLAQSLDVFPKIIKILASSPCASVKELRRSLEGFDPLVQSVQRTIVIGPPLSIREGGLIKTGVSAELDEIRSASINGKKWIATLQESERGRSGISSLRVGYNKVFGYYIEVSKANLSSVPENYIRKQTLTSGERFITPELKEMESKILGAEEKCSALEYDLFVALRKSIAAQCAAIQKAAGAIALLDVYVSLAKVASEYGYCRPVLTTGADLYIRDGRHPVVERMIPAGDQFVPNDTECKAADAQILLITGPNMAGKSTYLRQNALIALMAQMGSFVPAASAEVGIVDKFYTRVGASDRLARGQSTFLVEMIEVANILNNATDRSLVLLDEVGRGTSTFDGISIAWAVAEFLHEAEGHAARTFFATHYHELTELALLFPRIKNLHIKVKEWNDKIIFLRKIDAGSCDHSYGIQVARLAGVPRPVIIRAKEILSNLENMELTPDHKPVLARRKGEKKNAKQTDLFESGVQLNIVDSMQGEIIQQLQDMDLNQVTPLDALNLLAELKKKAGEIPG